VILTLVPYARWCPQRVKDVASALGVEALVPKTIAFSNLDGRHMDRAGAKTFTAWFLNALEDSVALKRDALTALSIAVSVSNAHCGRRS
jgi:hypothetical protein